MIRSHEELTQHHPSARSHVPRTMRMWLRLQALRRPAGVMREWLKHLGWKKS